MGVKKKKKALSGLFPKPVVFWVPCNDITIEKDLTASYKTPVMKSRRKKASFSQLKSMFQMDLLLLQT